MKDENLGKW